MTKVHPHHKFSDRQCLRINRTGARPHLSRGFPPGNPRPGVNSLLRAAARLEPEELFLDLSSALIGDSSVVALPCFHRASPITLGLFSDIHVPAGAEFPALETLYLGSCIDALDSLLSSCPRLRTLHLSGTVLNVPYVRVNSATLLECWVFQLRTIMLGVSFLQKVQ